MPILCCATVVNKLIGIIPRSSFACQAGCGKRIGCLLWAIIRSRIDDMACWSKGFAGQRAFALSSMQQFLHHIVHVLPVEKPIYKYFNLNTIIIKVAWLFFFWPLGLNWCWCACLIMVPSYVDTCRLIVSALGPEQVNAKKKKKITDPTACSVLSYGTREGKKIRCVWFCMVQDNCCSKPIAFIYHLEPYFFRTNFLEFVLHAIICMRDISVLKFAWSMHCPHSTLQVRIAPLLQFPSSLV